MLLSHLHDHDGPIAKHDFAGGHRARRERMIHENMGHCAALERGAPGGRYGLLELTTNSVWSEPAAKIRRTTLLAGPWHWTFDLSAPQFLMVTFVVVVGGLFATGWIRSQRFGR